MERWTVSELGGSSKEKMRRRQRRPCISSSQAEIGQRRRIAGILRLCQSKFTTGRTTKEADPDTLVNKPSPVRWRLASPKLEILSSVKCPPADNDAYRLYNSSTGGGTNSSSPSSSMTRPQEPNLGTCKKRRGSGISLF